MIKVTTGAVIDAPAEKVWAVLRPFQNMTVWHPAVVRSDREGAVGADAPGEIRALTVEGASAVLRERLESLSDETRTVTYSIVEGPLPVTNYLGTLSVHADTLSGRSFVEWGARCDATGGADEAETAAMMRFIYETGLKGLIEAVRTA